MCLKYNIGSLRTHSNDAIYHMLAKVLKFSTTKMHCAKYNQEDFIWVVTWAKVGERSEQMFLDMWS